MIMMSLFEISDKKGVLLKEKTRFLREIGFLLSTKIYRIN